MQTLDSMKMNGLVSEESYLYFVDDGSTDGSWSLLNELNEDVPGVRALKLSRNFGHQNALLAGLMTVKGRCEAAISIDADLQQDHLAIPRFVERYLSGAEVVLGIRTDRATDGWFKKATAMSFYSLMRNMGVTVMRNHADYRLLGGSALEALSDYSEPDPFLRAICAQLGFRTDVVYFDVKARTEGESKYSFRKMLELAVNGITSFSVFPLRLVSIVGFLLFAVSLLMACYVTFRVLFVGDTVPGWASTTLPIYFIGGVQILSLGVIGEYIARIATAVKRRPRYIVEREIT